MADETGAASGPPRKPGKLSSPTFQEEIIAGMRWMRDPRESLLRYGRVQDQKSGQAVPYNPHAITIDMQNTMLQYVGDPPKTETGQNRFLVALKSRQTGGSTCAELALYPVAAWTPGWDHICLADERGRARYLHQRVHFNHLRWEEAFRAPTIPLAERNQLTFDPLVGGQMRVLSAHRPEVGIGLSPDSLHASEIPFWGDAAKTWTYLYPAIRNRDHALGIFEATPAPADAPSVDFWQEMCQDARMRRGRFIYAFFPYWDGLLNRRPWPKQAELTDEEERLLLKYGPRGLTLENLAFRRETFETDKEIRRNPDLFGVFYPFDDVTCWVAAASGAIPKHVLRRHTEAPHLVPWTPSFMRYKEPEQGVNYVVIADPAGYASRDHAAFHVFAVWSDCWEQCAVYADHVGDPSLFARMLEREGRKYNNALVVVESTGVGQATLVALIASGYENIFYEAMGRPGKSATEASNQRLLAELVDGLMDKIVLYDDDTVRQLGTYKNDKILEQSERAELLQARGARKRRERHHWDKVSALLYLSEAAKRLPLRAKPTETSAATALPNIFRHPHLTEEEFARYMEAVRQEAATGPQKPAPTTPRTRYRSVRRRR
jgi:hypothetical protein